MHYYKRNIGDYAKKAGRLSILQHGVYNLLIDSCYDREQFPTTEEAIDWVWASSQEEVEAVKFVLKKFFVEIDGKWVQKRIEEEVANYKERGEKNKRIAQERETKRKEGSTKRARNVNESPPNHKPLTTNQEPLKEKDKKETPLAMLVCMGVSESIAKEWLAVRKLKKLAATQTAFNGVKREADKAGLSMQQAVTMAVEESWGGFKASWLKEVRDEKNNRTTTHESAAARAHRRNKEAYAAAIVEEQGSKDIRAVSGEVHKQVDIVN